MRPYRLVALCLLLLPTTSSWAEDDPRLTELLQPVIAAHQGTVSVAVKHLKTGASFSHQADEPMPTASLIKFPVMIAAYQQAADGTLDLNKSIVLKEEDKVPGSGILTQHFSAGTQVSLRDAIRLMIAYSDNTATNLVADQIGLAATTDLMTKWELPHTRLHSKVYRGDTSIAPERSKQFGLGSTTAAEMLRLLERLHRKELVNAEASKQMYDHLLACDDQSRLAKFLPSGTKIALKTGSVSAVRTVAGVIETPAGSIAVCVLTSNNKDQRWADDNAAQLLSAEIARQVWQHFHPVVVPTDEAPPTELAVGANGELVEALQRTLNQQLGEKSQLSVDGDFGPATKQAVVTFQKARNLPPTGIVGAETWKALGPLAMTADEQPSDPDAINKEVLPVAPADLLVGSPFVTADAWAIGEAKTGKLLWAEQGDERRDFASTTKTMTAWLVLREADQDAKLLDEIITFSSAADRTPGSTSGLKTGEKVSVRELLYGLMLPSGNDAAMALAEYVGPRFKPDGDSAEAARPVARFVDEMNRAASELGMKQTHYANPHGLPDNSHLSTASDQMLLAAKVMQSEPFRQYVQTRQHAVRVQGASGYTRNIVWKNTNKLLEISGYSGLKTGTTDAAGACLVSVGRHSGEELIVVVLGSSSNESRYTDTRNLFRWAWQQRGHRE
jgi:serine-type D-Ala-D-Ala carboxypeptidase (penicillin-binding protein 5/6)